MEREYQKEKPHEEAFPNADIELEDAPTLADGKKAERFAALPYRVAEAFASREIDAYDVLLLWWIRAHVHPPRYKYVVTLRELAHDLQWDALGLTTDTLRNRLKRLRAVGWIDFHPPATGSHKPYVLRLTGLELHTMAEALDPDSSLPPWATLEPPLKTLEKRGVLSSKVKARIPRFEARETRSSAGLDNGASSPDSKLSK